MKELIVDASVDNLEKVLAFVDEELESFGCSVKNAMRIQVAVEEIFVNIAQYAYENQNGTATIQIEKVDEKASVKITLKDHGIPYNPLSKEDPDVTAQAEDRPIGGLGIFMVKKTMDNVEYEFSDGQNCLTITTLI